VKSPDAPALEPSHPLTPKLETRFNVKAESDEYTPRYVDLPQRRRSVRAGQRNLVWGVALLCAALLVLAFSVLINDARVMLWPIVSMLTFTALWVLARLRLFHQRNGVFLALALVALLGSALSMGQRGFDRLAGTRSGATLPNVSTFDSGETMPAPEPAPAEAPLLSEAFHLLPPDPTDGSRVKILQDTQVTIARKNYRVQAGETFPLDGAKDGTVTFIAGEFHARIPQAGVQILGPQRTSSGPNAKTAKAAAAPQPEAKEPERSPRDIEIERLARADALRRFPALASPNSPENQEFVSAYKQLKDKHSPMLEDPEWPIRLAESLAQQSKWEEAEDDTSPAGATDEVVGRGVPPPAPPAGEIVGRTANPPSPVAPAASDATDRDTPPPPPPTPR
jgi:hypothetical protein